MQSTNQQLITEFWPVSNQRRIAVATLNNPNSLNALSLLILDGLIPCIRDWQADPSIVCILLQSTIPRAFCAGGDIRELYHCLKVGTAQAQSIAEQYFVKEYTLDYLIHSSSKPIICWGQGLVMGGGIGLLFGASHRIVTEDSLLAMPEISIGLFPDVGVAGHLANIPDGIGLYIALTGNRFSGADALELGFADYLLDSGSQKSVYALLKSLVWSADNEENHQLLNDGLQYYKKNTLSPIRQFYDVISEAISFNSCDSIVAAIQQHICHQQVWLQNGAKNLMQGSALSACLIYRHLQYCKDLNRHQVLMADLNLAVNILHYKQEIMEGVRALLIDKDKQPGWTFSAIENVPEKVICEHFRKRWEIQDNPLI